MNESEKTKNAILKRLDDSRERFYREHHDEVVRSVCTQAFLEGVEPVNAWKH